MINTLYNICPGNLHYINFFLPAVHNGLTIRMLGLRAWNKCIFAFAFASTFE